MNILRRRITSLFRILRQSVASEPVLGIAWYQENQWARLRDVSTDRDRLEPTFGEWLAVAQARYDALSKKETRVQKVHVDVEDMAAWCRQMGRTVDSEGRTAYVVYLLTLEKKSLNTKRVIPPAKLLK